MRLLIPAPFVLDPYRHRKLEFRSLAGFGFHPNTTAMRFDDAFCDRQTKPSSPLLFVDRAVGLMKLLENLGLVRHGNPVSCVTYRDGEGAVGYRCVNGHLACIGEFDRVAD